MKHRCRQECYDQDVDSELMTKTVVCLDCNQATTPGDITYPCRYCGGKVVSIELWEKLKV